MQVGRQLGVPDRGIAIALGAAMQESGMRNLDWGDRDSLGLFQQRPSTGWGTAAQVRDPVRPTKAFYGGPSDPNGIAHPRAARHPRLAEHDVHAGRAGRADLGVPRRVRAVGAAGVRVARRSRLTPHHGTATG